MGDDEPGAARAGSSGANPVLQWLLGEGRKFHETASFLYAFVRELQGSGVEVARVTTGVPILHPQVYSLSCLWEEGKPVSERRFRQEGSELQQFQNSPMAIVYAGGVVRRNIEGPPEPGEFPILADLRAQGMTDYLALPLRFTDGSWKALSFATRSRGGFPAEHVAMLQELVPTLAMILEIQTLRQTALTLLDTYVGRAAGRRVLDGAIKRGMSETIRAVIWACDLRGFTELSERLAGEELVDLLNDYFGAMTDAVAHHGGEVLKFIGDALLAIFPFSGETSSLTARRALAAAAQAEESIRALNEERRRSGRPLVRFGLALHVGEVLYGNIGGAERLDFTVIGQAVNIATRIEGLSKELHRNVLLSREVAELCGDAVEPLGTFSLKGVGIEQVVYAPVGTAGAQSTHPASGA